MKSLEERLLENNKGLRYTKENVNNILCTTINYINNNWLPTVIPDIKEIGVTFTLNNYDCILKYDNVPICQVPVTFSDSDLTDPGINIRKCGKRMRIRLCKVITNSCEKVFTEVFESLKNKLANCKTPEISQEIKEQVITSISSALTETYQSLVKADFSNDKLSLINAKTNSKISTLTLSEFFNTNTTDIPLYLYLKTPEERNEIISTYCKEAITNLSPTIRGEITIDFTIRPNKTTITGISKIDKTLRKPIKEYFNDITDILNQLAQYPLGFYSYPSNIKGTIQGYVVPEPRAIVKCEAFELKVETTSVEVVEKPEWSRLKELAGDNELIEVCNNLAETTAARNTPIFKRLELLKGGEYELIYNSIVYENKTDTFTFKLPNYFTNPEEWVESAKESFDKADNFYKTEIVEEKNRFKDKVLTTLLSNPIQYDILCNLRELESYSASALAKILGGYAYNGRYWGLSELQGKYKGRYKQDEMTSIIEDLVKDKYIRVFTKSIRTGYGSNHFKAIELTRTGQTALDILKEEYRNMSIDKINIQEITEWQYNWLINTLKQATRTRAISLQEYMYVLQYMKEGYAYAVRIESMKDIFTNAPTEIKQMLKAIAGTTTNKAKKEAILGLTN